MKGIDNMGFLNDLLPQKTTTGPTSIAILDENNVKDEREIVEKKAKIKSSFSSIAPIIDITDNDFFEMRSGEFMEILQITSKDIYSLNENDRYSDINNLANFYLSFTTDIKITPLNVALNLEKQKKFLYKKINQNKNPTYQPFLEKRLEEMKKLEKHRTNREYFIFIYEQNELKLLEKKHSLKNLLSRSNPLLELTLEKKYDVLFQLNNPNSKPLGENE